MTASEPGLRDFALAVYRIDGVSPASLLLQDRCRVDVNVLLLAAYVGAVRGGSFGSAEAAEAHRRVGQWQTDVVGPLRFLRERLREGPPPAPSPSTAQLRERVKALELDAELIELEELAVFADELGTPPHTDRHGGAPDERAAVAMNVVVHASACREPDAAERDAVAVIAVAAARYGNGVG